VALAKFEFLSPRSKIVYALKGAATGIGKQTILPLKYLGQTETETYFGTYRWPGFESCGRHGTDSSVG
jgi:hypothetical protein